MIGQILSLINKSVPTYLGLKGLEKINPRLRKFIAQATGAGFAADQVMDFIRGQFENPSAKAEENRLNKGMQQGNLRPDEEAAISHINDSRSGANLLQKGVSLATGLGAGALGMDEDENAAFTPQVLPAEQEQRQIEYGGPQGQLPSPEQAGFEQQAQMPNGPIEMGMSQSARRNAAQQQQAQPEPQQASSPIDILRQLDPGVASEFEKYLNQGQSPIEIAALLKKFHRDKKAITNIEQKTKQHFLDFIAQLFGQGQQQSQSLQQSQQNQRQPSANAQAIIAAISKYKQMSGK